MTLSIDRLGNHVEIEYNVDGNPVREISYDCDGKHREVRSWEYDTIGHLKKSVGGGFCYQYEYRPDGKLLRSQGTVPNRLLYGGQQYDLEVGQYYLWARYYNPVVGRFTQEDPYRGDGLNLYAYCANNPVTYYDPSGYVCNFNAQAEENAVRENATLQADGADGTQGGTDDVSWKNGWRTPDGKFASPKGEQKAGAWAEQDVWNSIKQKEGWSVIEGRVYTTDNTGQVRVYDGVAVTPDGHFIGLEVKSGNATKKTAQKAFDNRIGISNPATGIGKSKGITITHTVTIRR